MVSKIIYLIVAGTIVSELAGCTKKSDEPAFSTIPEIKLNEIRPLQVRADKDSVYFSIRFQDGDGNLGENRADVHNLFLTDTRENAVFRYRIPQIVPGEAKVAVRGDFGFSLPTVYLNDNLNEQSVTFTIYLTDRAGNRSNTLTCPPVTVKR